jgi:hypothetical protein
MNRCGCCLGNLSGIPRENCSRCDGTGWYEVIKAKQQEPESPEEWANKVKLQKQRQELQKKEQAWKDEMAGFRLRNRSAPKERPSQRKRLPDA